MRPERRILGLVTGGAILIAIAAGLAWFFTNFERQTREVPVGAAPEARRNSLLAMERLLAKLGIQVEGVPGREPLWSPPDPADTLVVRGVGPLSQARRARLIAWIESGGSLVTEAVDLWDDDTKGDDLLADLGVRLRRLDEREDRDQVQAQVRLAGLSVPLTLAFEPGWYLEVEDRPHESVEAGGRVRLVRLPVGEGTVTVLSDTELLTNERIGRHDHALLAAFLAQPGPGGKVWLLYDSAVPWLGAILWRAAPLAILSAAVLIPVWMWSLGARLGPLEPPPDRRRRDLLEHLDAAAAFLWRHGRASRLVEPARRRILADWERHRPELRRLDPAAQAAAIAESVGRPPAAVAETLTGQADDPRAFVVAAARLQDLWRSARPAHRGRGQENH